jgi:flagellar export protein FliJ
MSQPQGFRLQPVLNYKANIVDMLEVEFARLKLAHQQETAVLEQLQQTKTDEMNALHSRQNGALNCQAIQMHHQYLQALDRFIRQQTGRVEDAKHRADTKREELVNTVQDQKTLEKLKERHHTTQRQESLRREARIVDDLVITRYRQGR